MNVFKFPLSCEDRETFFAAGLRGISLGPQQNAKIMHTMTREKQEAMTVEEALRRLKDGNLRFRSGQVAGHNFLAQVNETSDGQWPFAAILTCIDSRAPTEIVFDQGIGGIFTVRVAGNVIDEDVVASLEFACAVAGARLIVVMGHTRCGAVKGAVEGLELGHLPQLLDKLAPAVQEAQAELSPADPNFMDRVSERNVAHAVALISRRSPVLAELLRQQKIGIVGALYRVETGEVQFFEEGLPAPGGA